MILATIRIKVNHAIKGTVTPIVAQTTHQVICEAPCPKGRGFCLTAMLRGGEHTGQKLGERISVDWRNLHKIEPLV
jgi:hypothetical protein